MQRGSLIRKSRKRGPDVWLFRWSEQGTPGKRVYRKRVIGTLDEYSDVDAARGAVAGLIAKINSANPRKGQDSMTIGQLCDHFEQRELAQQHLAQLFNQEVLRGLPKEMDCSSLGKI